MADSELLRAFCEYQKRLNLDVSTRHKLEPKAGLLHHIRRDAKIQSFTEFGERVGIEPLRLLLTEICADPKTYEVLSKEDFIKIAKICDFNISNWMKVID